jgi:alanine racemase
MSAASLQNCAPPTSKSISHACATPRVIVRHVAPARRAGAQGKRSYGHGLVAVAQMLAREQPFAVAVAYLEEALRLRQAGVRTPVLVLGGIVGAQIPRFLEHDLTLTASSVDKLLAIGGVCRGERR